jgi:hypothetical protein
MPNTENKYDIFISYRRVGGAQYARILQLMLMQRGYKVFLDYDELTDGVFGDHIKAAIKAAPVFMLVLSEQSMERCLNEDDWVRQEILLAIEQGKHLVPVNPDNSFDGFPNDTEDKQIPKTIREMVGLTQFSEIGFGQTLGITIDLMIKNRLVPTLGERNVAAHVDADYESAQETLRRQVAHHKFMKWLGIAGVAAVVLMVLGTCLWFWQNQKSKDREEADAAALEQLRVEIQERHNIFGLQFSPDLTALQMNTIDTLLQQMSVIRKDTLWMSQYEFTVGQWYGIKGESCDASQRRLPMTGLSYGDIYMFLVDLGDMTNLSVGLPSVEEWDYAAHGGSNNENSLYAGSDDVDSVAWYKDNSGGKVHASDGQQGKWPNTLDLYDMSGNVSELCNTAFSPGADNSPFTVCGGNYLSPAGEVTVSSRAPFDNDATAATMGFRIVIRRN